jgi:hypothetical protein
MIVLMKRGWKGYPHSIIFVQPCGLQMQKFDQPGRSAGDVSVILSAVDHGVGHHLTLST